MIVKEYAVYENHLRYMYYCTGCIFGGEINLVDFGDAGRLANPQINFPQINIPQIIRFLRNITIFQFF